MSDVYVMRADLSGKPIWAHQFGSIQDDFANAIAVDSAGSTLVGGTTHGTLPGGAAVGGRDLFLAKFLADGTRSWIVQRGTTADEEIYAVAVHGTSEIYVSGMTAGGLDGYSNAGSFDFFLTKFDGSGTHLWTRQLGGAANDYGNALAIDDLGVVFVAGMTYGNLDGHANLGNVDSFVARYEPDGTKVWLQTFGTSGFDFQSNRAIGVDDAGGVYVGGGTDGALNGEYNSGSGDGYVCRFLAATGALDWTRLIGGPGADNLSGLGVAPGPTIYAIGQTPAVASNPNLDTDLYLTTLDGFGNRGWTRILGSGDYDQGTLVAGDQGVLASVTTQQPFEGQQPVGGADSFVVKFDPNGTRQ